MTIVFRVPASAVKRVGFSYSPSMEALLSLHVLVEPKHHPVQHPWVRAMRRLSPALKREVDAFAFAFRAYFPEFLFPSPVGELLDFEGELRRLRAVDPALVRLEFAIPLIGPQAGGGEARDPAVLEEPAVRRQLRERAAEGDEALAELLLDDPVRCWSGSWGCWSATGKRRSRTSGSGSNQLWTSALCTARSPKRTQKRDAHGGARRGPVGDRRTDAPGPFLYVARGRGDRAERPL